MPPPVRLRCLRPRWLRPSHFVHNSSTTLSSGHADDCMKRSYQLILPARMKDHPNACASARQLEFGSVCSLYLLSFVVGCFLPIEARLFSHISFAMARASPELSLRLLALPPRLP